MQDCLWGPRGRAIMVLNLSPAAKSLAKTREVLEFGAEVYSTKLGPS